MLGKKPAIGQQHAPGNQRTLLVLPPDETLRVDPAKDATACTLNAVHIAPLAALEMREVEGVRWRKLKGTDGGKLDGWAKEEGHLASPWEWPGLEVHDEAAATGGSATTMPTRSRAISSSKVRDRVNASKIMCYGMEVGLFTGRKLSHYLTENSRDYRNARKIINGLDKAERIEELALYFEEILEKQKCG